MPYTQSAAAQSMQRNSMLLNGITRQQRDLFTGSLGIPDVSTHVGSVVHAFEMMAHNSTGSPTDTIGRASDLSLLPAENPYEMHADQMLGLDIGPIQSPDATDANENAGKRQSIYRKADSTMPTVNKSGHQTIVRHGQQFKAVSTPPPPPLVSQNLPILQPIRQAIADDFSSFEAIPAAPASQSYPSHTLPHARSYDASAVSAGHNVNRHFVPATQNQRQNAVEQQQQQPLPRSMLHRSTAVSGQLARKRASELARNRTIGDGTVGTLASVNASRSIGDYRRTLYGSQPNVIHDGHIFYDNHAPAQHTLARLNGCSANTNYANIDFREPLEPRSLGQPSKKSPHPPHTKLQPHSARSHTKNDSNNNAGHGYDSQIGHHHQQQHLPQPQQQQQHHHHQPSQLAGDVFAMHSSGLGNRFSNRTNTINSNNNNNNTHNPNNNGHGPQTHMNRLASANGNYTYHNDGDVDDDTDDATFLRGTTVSQSFIKNIKNSRAIHMPAKHAINRHSHGAFKRSDTLKPTTATATPKSTSKRLMSISRSYYKPQKYILNDDDDAMYENELRSRYTEHGGRSDTSKININRKSLPPK